MSKTELGRRIEQLRMRGIVDVSECAAVEIAKTQHDAERGAGLPAGLVFPHVLVGRHKERFVSRLSDRLIVWEAVEPGNLVSVVSSRLGRAVEERDAWFRALRASCCQAATDDRLILDVPGTAASVYVQRAAELFGVATVPVQVAEIGKSGKSGESTELSDDDSVEEIVEWFSTIESNHERCRESGVPEEPAIHVSPPFCGREEVATLADSAPLRDRLAVGIASNVVALFVRAGGNIDRLLHSRMENAESTAQADGQVRLAVGQNLTASKTRDVLLEAGAVGWYLFESPEQANQRADSTVVDPAIVARRLQGSADSSSSVVPDDVLIHCTRRCDGPWPDETPDERLVDLILADEQADHSALATLLHIIQTRCLIASSQSTRGPVPVVSFTSVRLDELRELRVFRSHRGRWDFEPYGICIRRDLLVATGARAVSYASDEEWTEMGEQDRPFFQLNRSVTRAGNIMDWTVEQEWRQIGNVDLSTLNPEDAWIFVPDEEEAAMARLVSPWPVVIVDS